MWVRDVIRQIESKVLNGHSFILVSIDYFIKKVEAISYVHVTKKVIVSFVKKNIISRYKVPSRIITYNGSNLNNKMITKLYKSFKIQHHNSFPFRLKMNGAIEAANKNIKKII
uniref:Integrase catalytic domain-containing protein n=1 Tax=Cajanus cajan TaxID=3821 RepID=A0A151SIT9_CAJCA|nr:hypothetical protein KK1_000909 [Cajanus cajan]